MRFKEVKMLTVTEGAKQHLKKVLAAGTDDPDLGIRLTVDASGEYGVALDREAPGDHVVEHEGSKVLLVGQEVAQLVAGATMDTKDTPNGINLFISKEAPES
jgi:Fe-S cluster assembly iron-binding protein IscA